jgi:signal transduction histidine kinase
MKSAAYEQGQPVSAEIQGADPQTVRANKLDLVERFADDLAHEIKNPLHSMVINLEVLKRRITREGGSAPEELMRYAGVLASELERVNRRVEILLRLVRPERGTELTSITQSVDELLELLELERERRNVEISFEPAPVPVRGHIPRDAARQIVLNMLLDSLDILSPGSVLTIRTEVEPEWIHLRMEGSRDPAAASAADREQSGAHLAVARTLAEVYGGRFELGTPGLEDPFCVTLSLPLSPT